MNKLPIRKYLHYAYALIAFASLLSLVTLSAINKTHLPLFFGILNVTFFLTVPGFLLTRILMLHGKFGPLLGYSVVLSISFLIFLGLLINNLLPVFSIYQPLSIFPFTLCANIALMVMFIIILINSGLSGFKFKLPNFSVHYLSWIFAGIAMLFPIFTGFGSNLLNNGGSNILTLIGLFSISIYLVIFIFVRKNLQDFVFPFSIYFISLAVLLMYSVRTPNLMGWDIHTEYKVFQLTKIQYLWTVLNYHNAYNATLGITILPTLLSNLIDIRDLFFFKIIYPIIFSFSCIGVYYIFKRYTSRTASYLAGIFLIFQLGYMSMPSLPRQEIAYLAFVFIILTIFDKVNKGLNKHALFIILASTIVVSHYTTTYITVGLFVSAYITGKFLQLLYKVIHTVKPKWQLPSLNLQLVGLNVLYMLLFTIFWYGIYTNASSNIQNFLKSVQANISKIQSQEGRAEQSWITVTGKGRNSDLTDLEQYTNQFSKVQRNKFMYPESIIARYPVYQVPHDIIPYNKLLKFYPDLLLLITKQLLKIVLIIGIIYVIFIFVIRRKLLLDTEFIIFSSFYLLLIIAAIFVPSISKQYNMERLYQQGLVFLAIIPVLLTLSTIPKIKKNIKYVGILLIFIYYFSGYNGLFNQFLGGYPKMSLNNYGAEYYQYYVRDSELTSIRWLNKVRDTKTFVHADLFAELRFAPESNISQMQEHIVPAAIWPGSYVYGSYENITVGRVQAQFNNVLLLYNYPKLFLNENKDRVYSNKVNEIYK